MNKEIDILKELVNINSFKQNENKDIIKYIEKKCKNFFTTTIKNKKDERESILIFINCEPYNSSAILLCGHIDTVKENNNLPAKIIDDKLYGLGSCDMKCFYASILANLDKIKDLNKPIIIAATCDEEIDCESVNQVVEELKKRNISIPLTILGEPTDMKIANSSKGCYEFQIEIKGKACHSSKVNEGINAINIAAKLINKIENLNSENISLNNGLINGGKQINIVPDYCLINFDIRCFDKKYYSQALCEIKKEISLLEEKYLGCKTKLNQTLNLPCYKSQTNFAKNICDSINLTLTDFNAASEAGFYSEISDEVIVFGAGEITLAHKENEYVKIPNLLKYYEILEKIIKIC